MKKYLLPPSVWLICIASMLAVHEWLPLLHIEPQSWRTSIGLTLFAMALSITLLHSRMFAREQTNINTFGQPDRLVEMGLFKWIRNPMYLGFVVALAALAFVMGALSPWLVVFGFFLLVDRWYIPFEERAMQVQFGVKYEEYAMRTRRWI